MRLSLPEVKGLVEWCSPVIDIVKLGAGTGYITGVVNKEKDLLAEKIKIYQDHGVHVAMGGTFFEACLLQDKIEEMIQFLNYYKIHHVEISLGSLPLKPSSESEFFVTNEDKLKYVQKFSSLGFKVFTEVGRKDDIVFTNQEWIDQIKNDFNAGAWKVIVEGRESGMTGIYSLQIS